MDDTQCRVAGFHRCDLMQVQSLKLFSLHILQQYEHEDRLEVPAAFRRSAYCSLLIRACLRVRRLCMLDNILRFHRLNVMFRNVFFVPPIHRKMNSCIFMPAAS
jgi:hypothetical protein